jgi:hypothetical protein
MRMLNLIDEYTRERMAIYVRRRINRVDAGHDQRRILNAGFIFRNAPILKLHSTLCLQAALMGWIASTCYFRNLTSLCSNALILPAQIQVCESVGTLQRKTQMLF